MTAELHVELLTTVLHAKSIDGGDEAVYDALRVVIGMHKPHKVRRADSLNCEAHDPSFPIGPHQFVDYDRDEIDACPDCVVTYPERCASKTCMDCGTYPCETLRNIAVVFDRLEPRGVA